MEHLVLENQHMLVQNTLLSLAKDYISGGAPTQARRPSCLTTLTIQTPVFQATLNDGQTSSHSLQRVREEVNLYAQEELLSPPITSPKNCGRMIQWLFKPLEEDSNFTYLNKYSTELPQFEGVAIAGELIHLLGFRDVLGFKVL